MRLAIIADVHGNLPALDAVLRDIWRRGADGVVNLGDCVSGPLWPRETCERLMELDLPTVRGNHDRVVGTGRPGALGLSDRHAYDALDDAQRAWLAGLPPRLTLAGGVTLFHATPADDMAYLLDEVADGRLTLAPLASIAARLAEVEEGVALCGHSHQPRAARLPTGQLVVNPGSVGCPAYSDDAPPHVSETGSPHARYAVLTLGEHGAEIELLAIPYDWESAAVEAEKNGRPSWAHALRTGFIGPGVSP
ncbi:metallophosphoesterase family protein [Chelatococcus sp. SYSU_G07232]|uniref:Metallophosphoesterase family protein n=1 Tax=Chelatococcus albus TaxID=3047466 RepID=A0ABT7AL13_9HYPH|nr:metallophosphoesterase family protein [Chelatococcus sp. SYSU_G07232]MDJ1160055.1 metallophosphoesterase family protein [Chelatococcus sp. SYSU_G07232]